MDKNNAVTPLGVLHEIEFREIHRDLSGEIGNAARNLVDDSGECDVQDVGGKNADSMVLPEELMELAEKMAENVHNVWAKTRIEQGWTYGPERNDAEKKHPCLIPYDQLPEEEKVYDRNTSLETLRFIVNAGFEIKKR